MLIQYSSKDLKDLLRDEPISERVALRFIHHFNNADPDEIDYANSVLQDSGSYLGSYSLGKFIKADISDEAAAAEISERKILIKRLCNLFPSIITYFRFSDDRKAANVFHIIHDCVSDFQGLSENGRKDANARKLKKNVRVARESLEKTISHIDELDEIESNSYKELRKYYHEKINDQHHLDFELYSLRADFDFLYYYLDYILFKLETDQDFRKISDNQTKTHIVQCAYYLTSAWDGPPLTTTPGSDFSMLCSLIYEIATGNATESLAGAINRFSRSKERRDEDQYYIEYGEEWERARDEDNFFDVKAAEVRLRSEIADLREALNSPKLTSDASILITLQLSKAIEDAECNEKKHGPFIMWAYQMNRDWDISLKSIEEQREVSKQLRIALGKRRRAKS